MKRWIHASLDTCQISPDYLRKEAIKFQNNCNPGPRGGTVRQSLYYDRVQGLCRYIVMLCDEALESGKDVPLTEIRNRIEGRIWEAERLGQTIYLEASEDLLSWFDDICKLS